MSTQSALTNRPEQWGEGLSGVAQDPALAERWREAEQTDQVGGRDPVIPRDDVLTPDTKRQQALFEAR